MWEKLFPLASSLTLISLLVAFVIVAATGCQTVDRLRNLRRPPPAAPPNPEPAAATSESKSEVRVIVPPPYPFTDDAPTER